MPNGIYQAMLSAYDLTSAEQRHNAATEVNQKIILTGLYHGRFFDKAAFHGDACLRIIFGLPRFTSGLQFSLSKPEEGFSFSDYSQSIVNEFLLVGQKVEIRGRKKLINEESTFLMEGVTTYDVLLGGKDPCKITVEMVTRPKQKTATEPKLLRALIPLYVRCFTLPCLFAEKMYALVYRSQKGRDWCQLPLSKERGL